MNRIEQSFADIAAANSLTRFAVAYRGEQFGDKYRFEATGHFNDPAPGQIACSSGDGASIEEATRAMLANVATARSVGLYGDDALMESDEESDERAAA